MEAWAKYAIQLTNQLGKRGVHTAKTIGEFTQIYREELSQMKSVHFFRRKYAVLCSGELYR